MGAIDYKLWDEIIAKPDWYVRLADDLMRIRELPGPNEEKYRVRQYFEDRLLEGRVALATSGMDLDEQREPIDTIVIHHTSNDKPYSLAKMNAVQLLNVYVPHYLNPGEGRESSLKHQPIWSNHFHRGKQVFYAYHWFIHRDGTAERLLADKHIGWHAGNWDINCRSVAICLDDDYTQKDPDVTTLRRLADLIRGNYPDVKPSGIVGHREVNARTICPGNSFLGGWKNDLLELLR